MNAAAIFGPMRLPFLLLTPACVFLGLATAMYSGATISWWQFGLILLGAIGGHVGVNALNEYDDFKTGLDDKTQRTPFSGGSGSLQKNRKQSHYALITGLFSLLLASAIGLYFVWLRGWGLLPLGLIAVLLAVTYTKYLTKNAVLCLIAPGLGFSLMSLGTHFVLTGSYSAMATAAALVPMFLVSDLLLLNQFPDVEADREVGRHHLPIAWGLRRAAQVYAAILALAYLTVIAAWALGLFPVWALLGLFSSVIALPTALAVQKYYNNIKELIPSMGKNVVINLLTPILLGLGFIVASMAGA